ncbi:MAG: hypothetical protein A2233_05295 [Candidatus Kerfeldbacteria bacterium RIFOXYA2_FULL_38_24]|uniref:Nucleotidyl transferase domain-containing protein n=1 Tax=Candidatus Kerfeldbacteria bacterium RIFOXYB2_FULL_38_14 TaxID=1798547 RepID=A0A1G2BGQ9_9BACT|nr:MAG: hypothetical protein A2233_05295 [Candidatus Kerfeldbacteria bacterium RIFOXYA2_FULL_38_24]OGY88245.1 MAG: hypothetical protein A2319_03590 [Candidatus Kerfeldbacteria bacterium RIFOXYB2_FULL_38_14]OGY89440.1 MAG: hypothetical protein A2458_00645 [Candidatus Kerfeldbacteria bacterium RIFOXYC2_FULL_38_9]
MKIVIRAGGVGTRLWPISREKEPKQFHKFIGNDTLLEQAIARVAPIVNSADIYVSTSHHTAHLIRERHHEILPQNIIIEPARKDTAAAIGLESIILSQKDPESIVASLGSDHEVKRTAEFQRMLQLAEEFVNRHPAYIIPIGIRPLRPDSGYGYIQYEKVLDTFQGKNLYQVNRFTEKPSEEQARIFLEQGNYLWNANMFVWKVSTILSLYEKHLPAMYAQLMEIKKALGTKEEREIIEKIYPQMEKVAVDYGIIEKTSQIAVLAADIGWNDIGDWSRLKDEIANSEKDNVVIDADNLSLKTSNTLIYSAQKNKMVVTIGLENTIIVDTEDALLVCDKYHAAEVKDVVQKLKERKKNHLL